MLTRTARVLGSDQGRLGRLGSIGVRFMVDSADSGGSFALVEHPIPPRKLAAPCIDTTGKTSTPSSSPARSACCSATRWSSARQAT